MPKLRGMREEDTPLQLTYHVGDLPAPLLGLFLQRHFDPGDREGAVSVLREPAQSDVRGCDQSFQLGLGGDEFAGLVPFPWMTIEELIEG